MLYRILASHREFLMMSFSNKYMLESLKTGKAIANDPSPVRYSNGWIAPSVAFVDGLPEYKNEKAMADILYDMGHLFLTSQAADVLKVFLNDGELLPVYYGSEKGYFFNPLKILEANDVLSLRDQYGDVTSLVFDEEAPLFKTEYDGYNGLFCNQEFKDTVEKSGFRGAVFSVNLSNIFTSGVQGDSH